MFLLFTLGCDCVAKSFHAVLPLGPYLLLDFVVLLPPPPPTGHLISQRSPIFLFYKNLNVFSTHRLTPSLVPFSFSVFRSHPALSYKTGSVSGQGSDQVSKFPFSVFSFLPLMALHLPRHLGSSSFDSPWCFPSLFAPGIWKAALLTTIPANASTPWELEGEGSTAASFVLFLLSRRALRAVLQEIPGLCQQSACEYWREVAAF